MRRLLATNPALRNQGLNTASAATMMQQARAGAGARTPNESGKARPAVSGPDVVALANEIKETLSKERKRLDAEQAELHKRRAHLHSETRQRLEQWLEANDPDVRSPVTQKILERDKAVFAEIGFSLNAYVDRRINKVR